MSAPPPPSVPESILSARGWTRVDDRTETVFEGLGVAVRSRTLLFEDRELRTAVADAGGPDRIWRFLFVSRLEIAPPPIFGMHAAIRPRIHRESKRVFAEELRGREIERIETGDTERVELAGDRRARLTPYRGSISTEKAPNGAAEIGVVGRLALWYDDDFYLAGCASPSGPIGGWTEVESDGETLFELIRTVA